MMIRIVSWLAVSSFDGDPPAGAVAAGLSCQGAGMTAAG